MCYNRDDKGIFKIGDFVVNKDPYHRYYNLRGKVIALTGFNIKEEDQSTFPKLVKGLYRFQEFKVQYFDGETTLLTNSEWFIKY